MPTLPEPTGGGDWVTVESGTYLALCYYVVEIGTQQTVWEGQAKQTPQVILRWELPGVDCPPDEEGVVMPATIGKTYTWSMNERAALRQHLEAWRGAKFEQKDFGPNGFEIFDVIGIPCTLSVMREESANGKTYSNIKSIGPKMRDQKVPPLAHAPVKLGLNSKQFDREVLANLGKATREKIEMSPEYVALIGGHTGRSGGYGQQSGRVDSSTWAKNAGRREAEKELDDEIPF